MQKGHLLQINCQNCAEPLLFSVFELKKHPQLTCLKCGLTYDFADPTLVGQLAKFEALCRQIQLSKDILSNMSIGITVGDREVKIPYKLLLSRLNSLLDLKVGEKTLSIKFRVEPIEDLPPLEPASGML